MNDFREPPPGLEERGFERLTPLAEAFAALAAHCRAIAPRQTPIDRALDRIAAAPIRAPAAVPARALALREGWAVASQDTLGASSYAPGFPSAPPVRIRFGDALPDCADAVLPSAGVAGTPPLFEILAPAAPGEGARAKAGDFTEGEIILRAGEKLTPIHVALARLAGVAEVSLRSPRLQILARSGAGDWLAAMAGREGAEARVDAIDTGDPGALARGLAPADADLVLVLGASEPGGPVARGLASRGKLLAHGIAVQPGQSMGCGVLESPAGTAAPVVFAPERIECALAAWLLLARPCLRLLAGTSDSERGEALALTRKITSDPGVADLVLLRRTGGAAMWEPLATGDIPWSAIAHADAWLLVEPECEGYAAGENVFVRFL